MAGICRTGVFRRAWAYRVRQQAAGGPNVYRASAGMSDNSNEGELQMRLRIPEYGNRGKESSKLNQDCTIRASCRSAMSGSAGPDQRTNRVNW